MRRKKRNSERWGRLLTSLVETDVSRETVIRRATVYDLDRLIPLAEEFYSASKSLGNFKPYIFIAIWTSLMSGGIGTVFIAESENGIEGTLGATLVCNGYDDGSVAEERFWFVRKESRGVGLDLYRAFERWAKEQGASEIQMVHLLDSMPEKLERFYRTEGYRPIETRWTRNL
jgi:GNAT superfamily N-acetyltransferase